MIIGQVALSRINKLRLINVKDYGAIGDGTTDDTTAITLAITVALSVRGIVYFPADTYKVTSQITIAGYGFITLMGQGDYQSIINGSQSSGDVFNITSTNMVVFKNLHIENTANQGSAINFAAGEGHKIYNCGLHNSSASNTNPCVVTVGANTIIDGCPGIQSVNQYSYAIQLTTKAGQNPNINSKITNNFIANTGNGILVTAHATNTRPEGLSITGNKFINTSTEQITINTILDIEINNNMLDQCSLYTIYLNPTGLGINGLRIHNNYISPATNVNNGVGIFGTVNAVGIIHASILDNRIAYAGYGVSLGSNASNIIIDGNMITDINDTGISLQQSATATITCNTFTTCTHSLALIDGVSGGYFIVENNQLVGTQTFTKTTPGKFIIRDNAGYISNGWSSNTFDASGAEAYVNVPHGLSDAPDEAKCMISISQYSSTGFVANAALIISVDTTNVLCVVKMSVPAEEAVGKINLYAEV